MKVNTKALMDYWTFAIGLTRKEWEMSKDKQIEEMTIGNKARDMVEVVRCKDCEHYFRGECCVKNHKPIFTYDVNIHHRREDDFCSYGERKEK